LHQYLNVFYLFQLGFRNDPVINHHRLEKCQKPVIIDPDSSQHGFG